MPAIRQPMPFKLDYALRTDPGQVRPLNEDAIGADPHANLFVLADGLGGYNAGEVASSMAVSTLIADLPRRLRTARERSEVFNAVLALRETCSAVNAEIYRAAKGSSQYEGMASTLVAAWLLGNELWLAHAGDSRAYRLREGKLEQITRDHSFSQELLDAGLVNEEEARTMPAKNLVTRALGAATDVDIEVHRHEPRDGDLVLLCSDGLTEMVSDEEIRGVLLGSRGDVALAARRLIELANEAGGRDNISVILFRVGLRTSEDHTDNAPAEFNDDHPLPEELAGPSTVGHGVG